jgi:hypothetical protein
MVKQIVRDKNGKPVGEIHRRQPEYDYTKNPKASTGKYYPQHFQKYKNNGRLNSKHIYFE